MLMMKNVKDTLDFPEITNYNNVHITKISKSCDEDTGILIRFKEREGKAETFLTRSECLPPLNSSQEMGWREKTVILLQSRLSFMKARSRVEPRVNNNSSLF